MKYHPSAISRFAQHILGKPLYPYQSEIAEAILTSMSEGKGHIFTIMMSRQSGKNQLSAVLEAYLLTCVPQGTIVKSCSNICTTECKQSFTATFSARYTTHP